MSVLEITMGVVLILMAVALTLVVLFQEGHQRSVGAITGAAGDTFLTKNKSRSIDSFLERWTRVIAIGFFLVVVATNIVLYFHFFGS